MACGALLPRALSGQEFLQASHFTLGPDVRLHADSRQATSHRHFPPHAAHPAPLLRPAPPRPPFLPAGPGAWARAPPVSESHCAFPSPPLQPQVARRALVQARTRAMQSSHVSAPGEADARAGRTGTSVAHACYRWLQGSPHARELILGARLIFDRDSVLKGDLSQPWRLPCTTNQEFFQPHHSCPQSRRAGRHLHDSNLLDWDSRKQENETSYKRQFLALASPPALTCPKAISSIEMGDTKANSKPMTSENKDFIKLQDLPPDRYNKGQASTHIYSVHIHPGDCLFRDKTTKAHYFYAHEPEPFFLHHDNTPQSHIMEGDRCQGPGSFSTSTSLCHGQPITTASMPGTRHQPHEALQGHVILGDPMLLKEFFHTSMSTSYRSPGMMPRLPIMPTLHLLHSSLPMGTGEQDFLTLKQKMMKPHRLCPASVTDQQLQRCKYNHIEPPLGRQRFLSTIYKDEYPCKYSGPIVLAQGSRQESHLPLGTMYQSCCMSKKSDLQACQTPTYPCPSSQ